MIIFWPVKDPHFKISLNLKASKRSFKKIICCVMAVMVKLHNFI